jgi:meso-butanediol dehydrogenase / (S,S)-butanediol dehydrogenase / diacetyl reductase
MRLADKVAIITGGGSGIGRATALRFAAEGARVLVSDIDTAAAEAVAREIVELKGAAVAVTADVSSAADAEMLAARAVKEYGRLDILHNNAGISRPGPLVADADEAYWDSVMAVNLKGVFLCSKYAVREMLKLGGGVVINTASIMGLVGLPGNAAYSASKGGVVQFTKSLALEYAPRGIRVNCIAAGWIDTPLNTELDDKITKWALRETPLGRWGTVEDVAAAALYLASDDAAFVTGTTLVLDGGWTAK